MVLFLPKKSRVKGLIVVLFAAQSCSDPDVEVHERRRMSSLMSKSTYLETMQGEQESVKSTAPSHIPEPSTQIKTTGEGASIEPGPDPKSQNTETNLNSKMYEMTKAHTETQSVEPSNTNDSTTSNPMNSLAMGETMETATSPSVTNNPVPAATATAAATATPKDEGTVLTWEPTELHSLMTRHCGTCHFWVHYKSQVTARLERMRASPSTYGSYSIEFSIQRGVMPKNTSNFANSSDGKRMIELLGSL